MSAPQLRLGPRVAVLKQGSEKSTGPDHIKSNAQACKSLADTVKVTLGPRGQDVIIIVG
ncbi:MAG: chaperonin-containing T-complex eta subunit Cct7, partial [Paramarteilia canceri]